MNDHQQGTWVSVEAPRRFAREPRKPTRTIIDVAALKKLAARGFDGRHKDDKQEEE